MKIRVCLVATILIGAIVLYALYRKDDVKAAFKVPLVEFSLETSDRCIESQHPKITDQEQVSDAKPTPGSPAAPASGPVQR